MKLKSTLRIALFTFFATALYAERANQVLDREQLSVAIVHLKQAKTETTKVDDKSMEVWLRIPEQGKLPTPKLVVSAGSAFLILHRNTPFLVTAAHLAKELTGTAMVTMSTTDSHPISIQLVDLIGTDPVFWKVNENADVAVHRLMPTPTLGPVLAGRFLPSELLVGKLSVPSRETPLLVMGFPLGLESSTYFSPLSRQTHAASGLLEEPGKNCVFFVLEDPSVGGYSGAPCFDTGIIKLGIATITSSDTKCYGMVRATLSDNTGGKLAVVVPSFYIVELLNEAAPNK